MQIRVTPNKATLAALIDACRAADLALSAGIRVALEWHAREQGRELPPTTERHRAWSAKTGDAPKQVLLYIPKPWVSLVGETQTGIRRTCVAALKGWLAAGAPAGELSRTTEQLRLRARSLKDNADTGAMMPVKLRLGHARGLAIAAADAENVSAATLLRRLIREAFAARTGEELPPVHETPLQLGRARMDGKNDLCVAVPIAWLVRLDAAVSGSRTAWIESEVCKRFGVERSKPAHSPAVAAMVETRRERARYELRGRSSAPRPEMADEAREQSRWPAGCGLCVGSITGRPFAGMLARVERAEEAA